MTLEADTGPSALQVPFPGSQGTHRSARVTRLCFCYEAVSAIGAEKENIWQSHAASCEEMHPPRKNGVCGVVLLQQCCLLSRRRGKCLPVPYRTLTNHCLSKHLLPLCGFPCCFLSTQCPSVGPSLSLLLPQAITSKTKAIVPVHYAGVGCEMDAIMEIATRHGIPVVEDNAHGLFGKYKGVSPQYTVIALAWKGTCTVQP